LISEIHHRAWFFVALMLIITGVVASTAIRIEWYNHAVGGYLPRPQPPSIEGNEVKWRTTSADMAEKSFRRSIAYDRGLERNHEALDSLELSNEELQEIDQVRRHARLNSEFRNLVSSMGVMQYPLVVIGLFLSGSSVCQRKNILRPFGLICLAVNLAACGLMLYREYYPSLGW